MEVLPFIGSWHPRIDELDREDSMQDVDRMQRALFKSINEAYRAGVPTQSHSINSRIDEAVRAVVDNSLKDVFVINTCWRRSREYFEQLCQGVDGKAT